MLGSPVWKACKLMHTVPHSCGFPMQTPRLSFQATHCLAASPPLTLTLKAVGSMQKRSILKEPGGMSFTPTSPSGLRMRVGWGRWCDVTWGGVHANGWP